MTWTRVLQIYLLLGFLAGYVLIFERPASQVDPKNLPPAVEESLLQVDPTTITALTFRQGSAEVHAVLADGRWQVLRPLEADISSDLLAAIVGTLTAGQAAEVMTSSGAVDLGEYGLRDPDVEIDIALRDRKQAVRVDLGSPNPTRTAVYAQRSDREAVFLVGLNLRYYVDLVLAGARVTR